MRKLSTCLTGMLSAIAITGALMAAPALADEAEVDQQIEEMLGDHQVYKDAIADIQQRVANEDSVAFSAYVEYPITVTINGRSKTIRSAEQFEPLYSDIITPEIAEVITGQDYGDLFISGDGIMFGNGEVWMNGICLDDKCENFEPRIITIQPTE